MNIVLNIENAVSVLSYADRKILCVIFAALDLSKDMNQATIDMKSIAKDTGFSRNLTINCVKILRSWGVISTENRGAMGTNILINNAEACRKIQELCL